MSPLILSIVLLCYVLAALASNFTLVKTYSGSSFFDDWDYYGGYDATTSGDELYVTRADSGNLTFLNSAGNAVIKVDNTTYVLSNDKRNSVHLTTQQYFGVGTVWVIDAHHIPWGYSVWPSIWSSGDDWPNNGEIDIIEAVNLMNFNQMAVHTRNGCNIEAGDSQAGKLTQTNCSLAQGCTVQETTANSYGQDFANNGGGVFAAQWDVSGIYIWFWPRKAVPQSLTAATNSLDISGWPTPSASFVSGSSCDTASFFGPQKLIIDIVLCGQWADAPGVYAQTCGDTQPNACYLDNVIFNGTSQYANAYFELASTRAFSLNGETTIFNSTNTTSPTSSSGSSGTPSTSSVPSPTAGAGDTTNGFVQLLPVRELTLLSFVLAFSILSL